MYAQQVVRSHIPGLLVLGYQRENAEAAMRRRSRHDSRNDCTAL